MMAWRDILIELRNELAEVRAQRQQHAAAEEAELKKDRDELARLADSLGIADLVSEMNATLLEGRGEIETVVSWDSADDEPERDDDEDDDGPDPVENEEDEEGDFIATLLSWDEDGEREIAVEVALTEEGTSFQVNGVEIRPEREALQQALVEAFRDELEL